eukprot:1951724-Pyramimonas_sp.AAC.1
MSRRRTVQGRERAPRYTNVTYPRAAGAEIHGGEGQQAPQEGEGCCLPGAPPPPYGPPQEGLQEGVDAVAGGDANGDADWD